MRLLIKKGNVTIAATKRNQSENKKDKKASKKLALILWYLKVIQYYSLY